MKTTAVIVIVVAVIASVTGIFWLSSNLQFLSSQVTTSSQTGELSTSEPQLIAGSSSGSRYLRFTKASYEQSLAEGKTIHLYFYATWCPICFAERPKIFAAYSDLKYQDVVGYEVHYNDNEVTADDRDIARQFNVPYQHTTIILDKNGNTVFKSFSPISKEQLISEIEKARSV